MSDDKEEVIPSVTEDPDESLDNTSKKGVFGWDTIGNIRIPYILRGEDHYLSVRMVENKLLSKYSKQYPEEISSRPPLASKFITTAEATLLNEINREHCQDGFGHHLFTTNDIVVKVQEFKDFFAIVQKHSDNIPIQLKPGELVKKKPKKCEGVKQKPESVKQKPVTCERVKQKPKRVKQKPEISERVKQKPRIRWATGGWVQVNNTIIPFVHRERALIKYVPLSVVKYAAGLLTDTTVEGYTLSEEECMCLTNICREAGLTFHFKQPAKALPIDLVCKLSKNVTVKELPEGDPFTHAEHSEDQGVEGAELAIPRSALLPAIHIPPKMIIRGTGMPPTNYYLNVAVNRQHSSIDSLMAQKSPLQPAVRHFNTAHAEAMLVSAANPTGHFSYTETLTTQAIPLQTPQSLTTHAQPSQKHLEKIQELHNRYLPQIYRPECDMTHTSLHTMPDPRLHTAGSSVINGPRWRMPQPHMQQHLSPYHKMLTHSQRINQVGRTSVYTTQSLCWLDVGFGS